MILCGEFVTHKVFGRGTITSADKQSVTVLFSDSNETKRFIFPNAFGTFLTPISQSISNQIQEYKDELNRSLAVEAAVPVVRELPKKVKKPAARKTASRKTQ
jgi:hypothetical protein